MTRTINSFMPNAGSMEWTISAQNVADHAAFTTAETFDVDGVLLKAEPQTPEMQTSKTAVAGDDAPIINVNQKKTDGVQISCEFVDDLFSGQAGEHGTDLLSNTEILLAFFNSKQEVGGIKLHPAGSAAGRYSFALSGRIYVKAVQLPGVDAAATNEARVTATLEAEDYVVAVNT